MEAFKDVKSEGQKKSNKEKAIMRVRKRDGSLEAVDVTKIVKRVTKCSEDLREIDPHRVAIKAISGLYDGASTKELDTLSIQTAAMLIGEEPQYSKLASRLLGMYIDEEVRNLGINSFSESVAYGTKVGIIHKDTLKFVKTHKAALEKAVKHRRDELFKYFGCLLYTSPSPRDATLSRMPSSA